MKFSPKSVVKLSVISLVALGLVGSTTGLANAKHRRYTYHSHRRYHYTKHTRRNGYWKKYRKHGRVRYAWHKYKKSKSKRVRRFKSKKKSRRKVQKKRRVHTEKLTEQPYDIDNLDNVSQMRYQTIKELNTDRAGYGLAPLRETVAMHRLAQMRSDKSAKLDYLTHYDKQGRTYYMKYAKRAHIRLGGWSGENIAGAGLGNIVMDTNPHVYSPTNGKEMAHMDEDEMLNHDGDSHWGHRQNMLNSHYTKVGVAVTHREGTNNYYLAENFSS